MSNPKIPISFKIDKNDKELVTQVYNNMGMNLSTAFTMFVKKSISEGGLPFDAKDPFYSKNNLNELTRRAHDVDNKKYKEHDLLDNEN